MNRCFLLGSLGVLLAVGISCFGVPGAFAQTSPEALAERPSQRRIDTERQLEALEHQISQYEQLLDERSREEKSELSRLNELDREITVRQKLITTYQRRNRQLESERNATEQAIANLQADLTNLTQRYRAFVTHAYKHGRINYLALLLTSSSWNQMLIRVKYLRKFTEQRRGQLDEIEAKTAQLAHRQKTLEENLTSNQDLLRKGEDERRKLATLKQERSQVISTLRQQKSAIKEDLDATRQEAEDLQNQLRVLIAAETARRRELSAADPVAAAELIELAASFSENRGRLSWPVQGVVTQHFGTRTHPVYGTKTPNPGLEIATSPGAEVHTIFDGVVNRIFPMPGYGTCITVTHGDYTTVYANFSSVNVRQGQRVRTGDLIGRAGTESEPRKSSLFFALFTPEGKPENPSPWLRPQ